MGTSDELSLKQKISSIVTHPTDRTVSDQSDRIPKSTCESSVRTFLEDLHGIAEDQSPSIRARGAQPVIDLTVDDVVQRPSIDAPVSQTVIDLTVDDVVQSSSIGAPVSQTVIDITADDEDNGRRFSFNVLRSFKLEPPPNKVLALTSHVIVISSDDPPPPLEHHPHVVDMEVETPNNSAEVEPCLVVISSDGKDDESKMPFHQSVILEPVERLLKKNTTYSVEIGDQRKELETQPGLHIGIHKEIDVSATDNMDGVENTEHIWSDEDVDVGTAEDMMGLELIDDHSHVILVQDCLESKYQREEFETPPDDDVDIDGNNMVSQRTSEKQHLNYQSSSRYIEDIECMAPSTELGIVADEMDVGTDTHNHVNEASQHDVGEGDIKDDRFYMVEDDKNNAEGDDKKITKEHDTSVMEEDDCIESNAPPASVPIMIIDSHEEQSEDQRPSYSFQEVFSPQPSYPVQDVVLRQPSEQPFSKDFKVRKRLGNKASVPEASLSAETEINKNAGVYVGVEDDEIPGEDDYMGDGWLELSMALEYSKDVGVDPSTEEKMSEGGEDCEHSFVLKDDIGCVCRICGLIDRRIDTIFEFQFNKAKRSTRTYMPNGKNRDSTEIDEVKLTEDGLIITEISAHPRHFKQMKPHQLQGFNFLVSNLVGDHPCGCILAHAPGSGKTFMIISFMQSFLTKYPNARPLVVLPKGILDTWKKEFKYWQVEDIPLFDLYEAKADGRSQQLEVLKKWVNQKSILFLGYKQFSSIVCDRDTSQATTLCQEILLKAPSILIMDEGHTPRNDNTDVFQSIAKLQTPRKVVLSGTIYQNHVKEVFNILNLVRPKFLRSETSRPIVKRIMSIVDIPSARKKFKGGCDAVFYELVEETLQKDKDFRRKVNVIHDLRDMTSKALHYYKGDSLDELPGLVDFTVVLNLSDWQKQKIEKEFKKFTQKFKQSSVGSAVYLHPKLYSVSKDWKVTDSNDKMDELVEKIDLKEGVKAKFFLNMLSLCESSGEKLLVFSQYLPPLKFLERLTAKKKGWSPGREMFVITGESNAEKREWSMERFNNSPDAKVFFGSIKACGEGISLVGASRVIILDVHLNPSVTRQAIGRAFRPGQKRKVFVYRLVAGDSPEEEDHCTCFQKELIAKLWFEWNEYCGYRNFQVDTVDVKECGDVFLESPVMGEDVKVLYRR